MAAKPPQMPPQYNSKVRNAKGLYEQIKGGLLPSKDDAVHWATMRNHRESLAKMRTTIPLPCRWQDVLWHCFPDGRRMLADQALLEMNGGRSELGPAFANLARAVGSGPWSFGLESHAGSRFWIAVSMAGSWPRPSGLPTYIIAESHPYQKELIEWSSKAHALERRLGKALASLEQRVPSDDAKALLAAGVLLPDLPLLAWTYE